MPRARLSTDGIDIAKPGYDVDTASIENMQFSSSLVAMRLALTGIVSVANFTGYMDDRYRRGQVTFGTPFVRPPIVMVAGLYPDGSTDQSPIVLRTVSDQQGRAWGLPVYQITVSTTGFDLFVTKDSWAGNRPTDWRYFVFQNTLDT